MMSAWGAGNLALVGSPMDGCLIEVEGDQGRNSHKVSRQWFCALFVLKKNEGEFAKKKSQNASRQWFYALYMLGFRVRV